MLLSLLVPLSIGFLGVFNVRHEKECFDEHACVSESDKKLRYISAKKHWTGIASGDFLFEVGVDDENFEEEADDDKRHEVDSVLIFEDETVACLLKDVFESHIKDEGDLTYRSKS